MSRYEAKGYFELCTLPTVRPYTVLLCVPGPLFQSVHNGADSCMLSISCLHAFEGRLIITEETLPQWSGISKITNRGVQVLSPHRNIKWNNYPYVKIPSQE